MLYLASGVERNTPVFAGILESVLMKAASSAPSQLPNAAAKNDVAKILHIAGPSRSGSTILERVLGNAAGVRLLGEVCYLWERGFLNDQQCACGAKFRACLFWREVVKEFESLHPGTDPQEIVRLAARVARIRHVAAHMLKLILPVFRQRVDSYAVFIKSIYASAKKTNDAAVLIDSSKHALGHVIVAIPNIELYVVHIVRDSRATACSWSRPKIYEKGADGDVLFPRFGAFLASCHWVMDNISAEILRFRCRNFLRVNYEDFASEPASVVNRILEFVGEDSCRPLVSRSGSVKLSVGHSVAGNPVRFQQGDTIIRLDDAWRTNMTAKNKWLTTLLSWPLLLRYGYILRSRAGSCGERPSKSSAEIAKKGLDAEHSR